MAGSEKKLLQRADRVAFMNTDTTGSTPKFERMTGFTTMTGSKEPKEYSRQYVDESTERSDVVGYAPGVEYSFDRHMNTPVHDKIAAISDNEMIGSDTHVDIVIVDKFTEDEQNRCEAVKRTYAVIPDSDGDGTDALIYSGNLKAVSKIIKGYATSEDDWATITFTEGTATVTTNFTGE